MQNDYFKPSDDCIKPQKIASSLDQLPPTLTEYLKPWDDCLGIITAARELGMIASSLEMIASSLGMIAHIPENCFSLE